jgi:hypothetical protein
MDPQLARRLADRVAQLGAREAERAAVVHALERGGDERRGGGRARERTDERRRLGGCARGAPSPNGDSSKNEEAVSRAAAPLTLG